MNIGGFGKRTKQSSPNPFDDVCLVRAFWFFFQKKGVAVGQDVKQRRARKLEADAQPERLRVGHCF